MDKDAESLCIYWPFVLFFENCLLNSFALLLTGLVVPLVFSSLHSGYVLDIESLSDEELAKIFSHSVGYPFIMVIALCCEEIFEFGAIPFVNS
jgi:hypothetical protein